MGLFEWSWSISKVGQMREMDFEDAQIEFLKQQCEGKCQRARGDARGDA